MSSYICQFAHTTIAILSPPAASVKAAAGFGDIFFEDLGGKTPDYERVMTSSCL
jgi:hypothetical protein